MKMVTKGVAALVAAVCLMPLVASAEQMATMPFDYSQVKTWDSDGNDFTLKDQSTNSQWVFPSGDRSFYRVVSALSHAGAGNLKQFAYIGNPIEQGERVAHASWVAPLSASGEPSACPARELGVGAMKFNPASLTVQQITTGARGYALTDGQTVVATVDRNADPQSLMLLKDMLQKYSLNVAWQIPAEQERDSTPVATGGPVSVFLKVDQTTAMTAMKDNPAPTSAPVMDMAKPQSEGCKWWAAQCWIKKAM